MPWEHIIRRPGHLGKGRVIAERDAMPDDRSSPAGYRSGPTSTRLAEAVQVETVLGDLVALLLSGDSRRLSEGTLELRRGDEILHLPAPFAHHVMVMTGEGLGELIATVLVGPGDPLDHAHLDQRHDIAVCTALGDARCCGEDLWHGEGAARLCEHLDQPTPLSCVALLGPGETETDRFMKRRFKNHS